MYQVRTSTLFLKHLLMKHSNVWRTVFYFLLMTHLCGDLGEPGRPGETINKAMHNILTLWMIVFYFLIMTHLCGDLCDTGRPGETINKAMHNILILWMIVSYFLLMTHLCGDLGDAGPTGETINKACTTHSTLIYWSIYSYYYYIISYLHILPSYTHAPTFHHCVTDVLSPSSITNTCGQPTHNLYCRSARCAR